MEMFAAIHLLLTVSNCQFGLGLVIILLLGLVFTESKEYSIFCLPSAKAQKEVKN